MQEEEALQDEWKARSAVREKYRNMQEVDRLTVLREDLTDWINGVLGLGLHADSLLAVWHLLHRHITPHLFTSVVEHGRGHPGACRSHREGWQPTD